MKTDDRHLAALRAHWRRHKVFPPMSKLAQVLGLASASGVLKVLRRLTKAGYLEQIDGRVAPTPTFFARPVLSHDSVDDSMQAYRAGTGPTLNLEDYLLEHADRACYCVVQGDEMRDAGLLDGDVVVLEATRRPRPGDIVVAMVDGRTSVRYLAHDDLDDPSPPLPAGDTIELQRPPPFEVLGVVVGSFRRYQH